MRVRARIGLGIFVAPRNQPKLAKTVPSVALEETMLSCHARLERQGFFLKTWYGEDVRLTKSQFQELATLLNKGAEVFGFTGQVWTCRRIAAVVEEHFHVHYHPSHISKLLHHRHWSYQKPVLHASEKKESEVAEWVCRKWPTIKNKALEEGRTIIFVDESGFYQTPAVGKTWSKEGHTPTLKTPFHREHLSVIGGLTLEGSLYMQVHRTSMDAHGVIQFVTHLLRLIPGKLMILWDRSNMHKGQKMQDFLALDEGHRLEVEKFPPYAPEVDPQEFIWRHLKHVDLKNLTNVDLDELWKKLRSATKNLRKRVGLLRNLIHHAGLELSYACKHQ